jgi:CubicO group peptidase (beta-lactamase class C family)
VVVGGSYGGAVTDWSLFSDLDPHLPGLVVGIVDGGSVVWGSFGSAVPGGERLGEHSVVYVSSIAKQFTAATVGTLVLDGALTLEDSVRRWLPELSVDWAPVTVEHLIAHTGGLVDSNPVDTAAGWGVDCEFSTWDRVAIVATTSPECRPGIVHRYTNHGYVLLAAVVERVTGETLGDVARRVLFEPAAMCDSRFVDTLGGVGVPGWIGGSQRVDIRFSCCGDGGLLTTLADLAAWDAWLPASRLAPLMLATRPVLVNGRTAHDAWGISIRSHRGLRIESHGGSIDGYMASFVRFPAVATTFIVLANTDQFGVTGFGRRIENLADSILGSHLHHRKPPWTDTHGEPLDP